MTEPTNNPNAAAGSTRRSIPLMSMGPIPPGGTGQIVTKIGAADLLGIEVEEGAKADRLYASQLKLTLKDESLSPEEMFAKATQDNGGPIRIKGVVTLLVRNVSEDAKHIKVALVVDNEEAAVEPVKQPRPVGSAPVGSVHTKVSSGVASGSKRAGAQRLAQVPKVQRRQTNVRPSAVKEIRSAPGVRSVGAVRHATQPELEMVLPEPGQHAVLMLRGHVYGLVRFLTTRVPLHPSYVPTIGRQLLQGLQRTGAVSVGGNEVAVLLTAQQIVRLNAIVGQRFNSMSPEETALIVEALNNPHDQSRPQPANVKLLEAAEPSAAAEE